MQNISVTRWGRHPGVLCLGFIAALSGCSDGKSDAAAYDDGGAVASDGGSGVPSALQADLQGILDDAVAQGTTPGVSLQVAVGDQTWFAAAGIDDLDGKTAMVPNQRFRAGSIVKTLVATAVLQAVEAGTLGLDDVLTDHLPSAITARVVNASTIRLRMLLEHRSGIPDWVTDEVYQAALTDPEHVWTLDEILAEAAKQPAAFQPGEHYAYSNTNYVLLGELLTGISGRSWRDVLRDDVIATSGLTETLLPEPGDPECPACAHGYVSVNDEMLDVTRVDPSMAGASGGHALIATPGDLTRFFRKLRTGALFEHPTTVDSMFAFQPAIDPELRQVGYGFGVMQMSSNGNIAVGNLGGTAGYQSFMLYVPATDRYVSGFINTMGDLGAVLEPILARVATP